MKTSMHSFKKFVPALALAVTALSVSAAETAKLTVDGMVCAFCAQGIEKRLSALPSTQSLYVNLEQKIVAIEAKPGQALDLERIKAEVIDAGYAVAKTETVTQSVAEIKAAMKAKK